MNVPDVVALAAVRHPSQGAAVASSVFVIVVWTMLTVIVHLHPRGSKWISYVMLVVLGALIVGTAGKLGSALREVVSFIDQALAYLASWLSS